jgi:hypothetical protein
VPLERAAHPFNRADVDTDPHDHRSPSYLA